MYALYVSLFFCNSEALIRDRSAIPVVANIEVCGLQRATVILDFFFLFRREFAVFVLH